MMSVCSATDTGVLRRGDDWVWSYTFTSTSGATLTDLVVELLDGSRTVWASTEDDTPIVATDGGLGGAIPATDLDAGVLAFWVAAEHTTDPPMMIRPLVKARIDGVDTTIPFGKWSTAVGVVRHG